MRFIILLDISPLLFECCPYVGNVQVIESEGCIPSVNRVSVIALICNTRGDERLLFWLMIFSCWILIWLSLNMRCFEVAVLLEMYLRILLCRCWFIWLKMLCWWFIRCLKKCYISTMNAMNLLEEFVTSRFVCVIEF